MVKPKSSATANSEKVTQPMFSDQEDSDTDEGESGRVAEPVNRVEAREPQPALAVVKPEPGGDQGPSEDSPYVRVSVRCILAVEQYIEFKMKKKASFKKLMTQFTHRFNIDEGACRFLFDGKRVHSTSTPEELEMMDGDTIEVHVEQLGGRFC